MPPRKIALVGIGKIARDQHAPSIAASDDWHLAATVSRHRTLNGVPAYKTLSDMFVHHPEIDTVSLCTPPIPRFAQAAEALAAGRHVMLEKPPGATLSEVETLCQMAETRGLTLFATWHSRHAPFVRTARHWLADKTIQALEVQWKEDVRKWHPGQDWVFEPGGMGVFDPGINALSIVTEILGDPLHLSSAELDVPSNRQTPITARLLFHHSAEARVTMEFDWVHTGKDIWRIAVETTAGDLVLDDGGARLQIDGGAQEAPLEERIGEYPSLYRKMAALVGAGRSDVDVAPLRHVADAFLLGRRRIMDAFEW
jgi:D-galactose 1-dehydrogenase